MKKLSKVTLSSKLGFSGRLKWLLEYLKVIDALLLKN